MEMRQRWISFPVMIIVIQVCLIQALAVAPATPSPSCQRLCGNLGFQIEFPFGIGEGCFFNKSFEVICNDSKLFLTSINMEVDIIMTGGAVRVKNPVISSNCNNKSNTNTSTGLEISLLGTPFVFSNVSNKFTALGCNNYAMLVVGAQTTIGGCLSFCPKNYSDVTGCYGINCCQASIPPNIQAFQLNTTDPFSTVLQDPSTSCKSAFMVDQDWFASKLSTSPSYNDLYLLDNVPVILDWANEQGYCDMSKEPNVSCTLDRFYCWKQIHTSQLCVCRQCQDFRRCTDPSNYYNCQLYCLYTPGGYNCSCPLGHSYNGVTCYPDHVLWGKSESKTKSIVIGVASGLGLLLLLIGLWLSYKLVKRRQAEKLKHKFFKRNGGLLLEQQLSSTENHVEQTKLFTSKELEIATDHFHVNRILGQGGQGTGVKD